MRRRALLISSVVVIVVVVRALMAAPKSQDVERGRYLVHDVAMCVQCHTPRDGQGALVENELLRGAPMPLASPFANQTWAPQVPMIAGLPGGWSETDVAHFLETGLSPSSEYARPPMPPFRMTKDDAAAVAAYLKSLATR
jgi:mono/diheme cytochrome c family protein